jgi:hypothetical protein
LSSLGSRDEDALTGESLFLGCLQPFSLGEFAYPAQIVSHFSNSSSKHQRGILLIYCNEGSAGTTTLGVVIGSGGSTGTGGNTH